MIDRSMASIRAQVSEGLSALALSALSRSALDRPLLHPAELLVAVPSDEALALGAHQRSCEVPGDLPRVRRGSGGAEARVGRGSVWLQLSLVAPSALVPCPPERLVNRYVRPLLRAITKVGVLAHYFERDWVSGLKRPVASIAFGHDTTSGRAFVEAIVAVTTPFAVRERASTMGKAPATLAELGCSADAPAVARAIVASYEAAYGASPGELSDAPAIDEPVVDDPPWSATTMEAIGLIGAGCDRNRRLRLGGELMVSRDALMRLERALETPPEDLGALLDATLGAPGVALFGVRSLRSLRDLLARAR